MNAITELSTEDLHDAYIAAARLFMSDPGHLNMEHMLGRYAAFYVSFTESHKGLQEELNKMATQARNVIAGRP